MVCSARKMRATSSGSPGFEFSSSSADSRSTSNSRPSSRKAFLNWSALLKIDNLHPAGSSGFYWKKKLLKAALAQRGGNFAGDVLGKGEIDACCFRATQQTEQMDSYQHPDRRQLPDEPHLQSQSRAPVMLFNRFGEPSVTVSAIAADIGISHGNLYYHYPSKEKIVEDLFR